MFKFFEGLVDPYAPYTQTDTPPRQLWRYEEEGRLFLCGGVSSELVKSGIPLWCRS